MEAEERFESYYSVLGVSIESSIDEVRRAYRKLAMQWHPDRWARQNPCLVGEAKRRFQKIQEAYSVLSDPKKREMYNAGFYDPNDEVDEGFCDFMHEMFNLMAQVRAEEKTYSIKDLQITLSELMKSFENPQWFPSPPNPVTSNHGSQWSTSGRAQSSQMPSSDFKMSGISSLAGRKF